MCSANPPPTNGSPRTSCRSCERHSWNASRRSRRRRKDRPTTRSRGRSTREAVPPRMPTAGPVSQGGATTMRRNACGRCGPARSRGCDAVCSATRRLRRRSPTTSRSAAKSSVGFDKPTPRSPPSSTPSRESSYHRGRVPTRSGIARACHRDETSTRSTRKRSRPKRVGGSRCGWSTRCSPTAARKKSASTSTA